MNLPDLNETVLDDLNRTFFSLHFCGTEKETIKRTLIFQSYKAGGLKMVDVKSFLVALKITWLKRILSNDGKITKILRMHCVRLLNS